VTENAKGLISAFLFTVRNEAGALANAIGIIGRHGMNLRCLRSRPMHGLDWKYYFYAELDGNIDCDEGKWMLRELATSCDCLKVAGIYRESDLEEDHGEE
jgi:chorismate mutase/prephenate dehydratase